MVVATHIQVAVNKRKNQGGEQNLTEHCIQSKIVSLGGANTGLTGRRGIDLRGKGGLRGAKGRGLGCDVV